MEGGLSPSATRNTRIPSPRRSNGDFVIRGSKAFSKAPFLSRLTSRWVPEVLLPHTVRSRKKRRADPVRPAAVGAGAQPSPSPAPLAEAIVRRRRFWFRVAALLSPFFLLLGAEAGLRLAGWGYPTAFFLKKKHDGKTIIT